MGSFEGRLQRNRVRQLKKRGIMRQVTFTKKQFKDFVYPFVGQGNAKADGDWETALRLVKKFKDPILTEKVPLNKEEQKAEDEGSTVFCFRTLLTEDATFELEEDEWGLLKQILEGRRKNIIFLAAEDFEELLAVIREAKQVDAKEKKVVPSLVAGHS